MPYQESERAKKMENPNLRGPLEHAAQRFARLAEKLERDVRRRRSVGDDLSAAVTATLHTPQPHRRAQEYVRRRRASTLVSAVASFRSCMLH